MGTKVGYGDNRGEVETISKDKYLNGFSVKWKSEMEQ